MITISAQENEIPSGRYRLLNNFTFMLFSCFFDKNFMGKLKHCEVLLHTAHISIIMFSKNNY